MRRTRRAASTHGASSSIDLKRLVTLWTEHYAKLDEAARRRLPLQPIYFLAPEG